MASRWMALLGIILIGSMAVSQLWMDTGVGSDDQAQAVAQQLHPDYRPWREPVHNLSAGDEPWALAAQGVLGMLGLGVMIGMRARKGR
ncbi:MAG: hypothetical protein FJW29_13405 [Acidobacteria bacterium]|nr:hypothetical protein [Acidobacteriota bacterium]